MRFLRRVPLCQTTTVCAQRAANQSTFSETLLFVNARVHRHSFRSMLESGLARGRVLLRTLFGRRGPNSNALSAELKSKSVAVSFAPRQASLAAEQLRFVQQLFSGQRALFGRYVSRWSRNSLVADLRRQAAVKGTTGLVSFGLVGICVKENGQPGLFNEFDEIEWQCSQIRSIFAARESKLLNRIQFNPEELQLSTLKFGTAIAKGCNAVVYEATIKNEEVSRSFGNQQLIAESYKISDSSSSPKLAVKMMFNYEAESNAAAIWSAMNKECLPFNGSFGNFENLEIVGKKRKALPTHPNIVEIVGVFADYVPELKDAFKLYPDALPSRINQFGYGRNMTLFLVMKRYDVSLKEYVSKQRPDSHTGTSLVAQLLEGVSFLVRCNVAHRDLKTDNLLLDTSTETPWLVITDFGFCSSLQLPLTSDDVCRGGNRALMAPEIVLAEPGAFVKLDYSKSDLWAAGAIALEIFGGPAANPFYPHPTKNAFLHNYSYRDDDLSDFPRKMPRPLQGLVRNMLKKEPFKRPTAEEAAVACQLVLHSSERFLSRLNSLVERSELKAANAVLRWLTSLSMSTLCGQKRSKGDPLSETEAKLRLMFLSQVRVQLVCDVLKKHFLS